MKKSFVFIKLKNKNAIKKINIKPVKKTRGIFAIKKIDLCAKTPYFVVSDFKIKKVTGRFEKNDIIEKGDKKSLKGDIYGK